MRVGETFHEIEWNEAFDRAAEGFRGVIERHGPQSIGVYGGNPSAHVVGIQMGLGGLLQAMPALFTNSGSIDCYPRFLVDAYMYGNIGHVPIPDIERTDFFLIFGGNPMVSNGRMMGASNMPARLRRLRQRGGKLVVNVNILSDDLAYDVPSGGACFNGTPVEVESCEMMAPVSG